MKYARESLVRTLALSDLHLGRRSTYAHSPDVLAPLVAGFDRVLLLGDVIDHWYTHAAEAAALEHRVRALCKAGGVKEVVYFRGNHDACSVEAEEYALLDGVLYLHGHAVYHRLKGQGGARTRIEALNRKRFGARREGRRRDRRIWRLVDRVYTRIPMAVWNPLIWPWPVRRRIQALVAEVAPPGEIQAVVLGHSHRPGVRRSGGLTLFNLGGWMRNTRAYAFVREGNQVRLVHIENRGHLLKWGKTVYEAELK